MAQPTFYSLNHFVLENVHQSLAQKNFTFFAFGSYKHCFLMEDIFTRLTLIVGLLLKSEHAINKCISPPTTSSCRRESSQWGERCQNTRLILDNGSSLNFLQTLNCKLANKVKQEIGGAMCLYMYLYTHNKVLNFMCVWL